MIWPGGLPQAVRQDQQEREQKWAEVQRTYRGLRAQTVAYTAWVDSRWRGWWEEDSPPVAVRAQPEDDENCGPLVELAKEILT